MSDMNDTHESLWHTPHTKEDVWRPAEEDDKDAGTWRRVKAIPVELEEKPDEEGAWHRPAASDTPFTPEDTLDITVNPEDESAGAIPADAQPIAPEEAVRLQAPEDILAPEDLVLTLDSGQSTPDEPEPAGTPQAVLAPEDLIYQIEHLDESQDPDFERNSWSELVALASLAENAIEGVQHGADSPISADLALSSSTEKSQEINMQMLSPAERMALGGTGGTEEINAEVVDENDPAAVARRQMQSLMGDQAATAEFSEVASSSEDAAAAYARQQLENLMGGTGGTTGVGTATSAGAAYDPNDPGAYARQQMGNLGGTAGAMGGGAPTLPIEELSPREVDLLKRYRDVQQQVNLLRQQVQIGQITQDQYIEQLRSMMILDDDQVWWMMGVDSNSWYRADNGQWAEGTPEVFEKERRVNSQAGATQGYQDSGDYGSLPYFNEAPAPAAQQGYGEYTPTASDEYDMPLPRAVPVEDEYATVPSKSVFNMGTATNAADTVPSLAHDSPTMMAQPVDYGTIESPYDQSEPPIYDLDEDEEGELYGQARARARQRTVRTVTLVAVVFFVIAALGAAGLIALSVSWYEGVAGEWEVPIAALANIEETSTFRTVEILDRDGRLIAELSLGGDVRQPVSIQEVSPYFIHAMLAVAEDPNYYDAKSWEFADRLGAFVGDMTGGTSVDAVSPILLTIARQLVIGDKSFASDEERARTERIVVNELVTQYTLAELLELYFNDILFFGNQTFGVEAAADFYFGDDPANNSAATLTFPQAAMLGAILKDPAQNDPISDFDGMLGQMDTVMRQMAEVGCIDFQAPLPAGGANQTCITADMITSAQVQNHRSRLVLYMRKTPKGDVTEFPHFVSLVENQLNAVFGNEIYRSGYRVTTTLDRSIQSNAEVLLGQQIRNMSVNGVNTGAVVVTDPRTGELLALVGSPDYTDTDLLGYEDKSRTYQEPGDVILPIIYAMALDGSDRNGDGLYDPIAGDYITPASILWDVPNSTYPNGDTIPLTTQQFGAVSARRAFGNGANVPAVKLYETYGAAARFIQYAQTLGIRFADVDTLTANPPQTLPLGTESVRLYDVMKLYGAIAANGQLHTPYTIISIKDFTGNEIPVPTELQSSAETVLSPELAYLLQDLLSDDASRTPAFPQNSPLVVSSAATGAMSATTNNSRDLWTVGFSTNRVVGVWMGSFNDQPVLNNTTGLTAAAPLWNAVMRAAIAGTQTGQFQRPTGVEEGQVCADTGALYSAGQSCATIANDRWMSNHRPPASQPFIVTETIDTWTGLKANTNCPDNQLAMAFVAIDDASGLAWLNNTAAGQAYAARVGIPLPAVAAPTQACDVNVSIPAARIDSPQGNQTIQGEVSITGQVGETEFRRYEVQIAQQGTENFQTITTSTTAAPNANSILATWDTRQYPDGAYTIRLAVFANNAFNGYVYRTVSNVIVDNPDPTPTPTPTATIVPSATPMILPTLELNTPLPFDTLAPIVPTQSIGEPTPTIDPLGG